MGKQRVSYWVSDIHLSADQPFIQAHFLNFLHYVQNHLENIESLYILGDLFDAWIGDDDPAPYTLPAVDTLITLARTMPVYVLPGNRDFLLGSDFFQRTGLRLLTPWTRREHHGHTVWMLHGDEASLHEKGYQRFRRWVRTPWVQRLFLTLPLSTRQAIAQWLRSRSTGRSDWIPVDDQTWLTGVATAGQAVLAPDPKDRPWVIHGHIHKPGLLTHPAFQVMVLGDWRADGAMVGCIGPDRSITLRHWPQDFKENPAHLWPFPAS